VDAYHVAVLVAGFLEVAAVLAALVFGVVALDWYIFVGANIFYNVKGLRNV
jgi:hypothetical protein